MGGFKRVCFIIYLLTAIGLSPGGSGYFTRKQNMKLVTTEFNLQTPNVNYIGRTAPLTSKVAFYIFIQQI